MIHGGEYYIQKVQRYYEILKYLRKDTGPTMNQVATEMTKKGVCSRLTTLRIIEDLISHGFVEDKPKNKNSFHALYISDPVVTQSVTKMIIREALTDTEKEVEKMIAFMHLTKNVKVSVKIVAKDTGKEVILE